MNVPMLTQCILHLGILAEGLWCFRLARILFARLVPESWNFRGSGPGVSRLFILNPSLVFQLVKLNIMLCRGDGLVSAFRVVVPLQHVDSTKEHLQPEAPCLTCGFGGNGAEVRVSTKAVCRRSCAARLLFSVFPFPQKSFECVFRLPRRYWTDDRGPSAAYDQLIPTPFPFLLPNPALQACRQRVSCGLLRQIQAMLKLDSRPMDDCSIGDPRIGFQGLSRRALN